MNKDRRKRIAAITQQVETLKTETEELLSEEQDVFENMPESLQNSERGELTQEAINNLQRAVDATDELIGALESASE